MGWSPMMAECLLPFSRYVKLNNSRYIFERWKQRNPFIQLLSCVYSDPILVIPTNKTYVESKQQN